MNSRFSNKLIFKTLDKIFYNDVTLKFYILLYTQNKSIKRDIFLIAEKKI